LDFDSQTFPGAQTGAHARRHKKFLRGRVVRENLNENARLGKIAGQVAECRESSERHRSSSEEITSNHVRSAALMDGDNEANLLDDLLAQVNLRARITFRGKVCGRWAIGGSRQGRLGFHAVLSGQCWLRVPDVTAPVEMTAGALLIYRPDTEHLLADTGLARHASSPARILPISSEFAGANVGLLCGYFEGGVANIPVVDALPAYLMWPNFSVYPEPLGRLVGALTSCALDEARCREHVLQRFFELMLLMILREPLVLKVDNIGVLRAQRDPILRRAFNAIHARPGRHWTLASLANSAGVSRSAFAVRFKHLAEISAMHYLRRYRIALAERRIREESISVEQAARAIGYRSARAFRRAARRR
jgi:AraC family transcriptional regulator, activator of mtrCDE